jgi:glycine cleavage system H protein
MSTPYPADRRYLPTHEWHKLDGDTVAIGITQFAADELTDITFVKLPAAGDAVRAGSPFGEIESVKATADLVSGVSGTVAAVNGELADNPALVNKDPYEGAWMIKVKVTDRGALGKLLGADEYAKAVGR